MDLECIFELSMNCDGPWIVNVIMINCPDMNDHIVPTGFPRLLENLEKPGIYFGSLNPGNSLEFCIKNLDPLEICERYQKIDQHRYIYFSL